MTMQFFRGLAFAALLAAAAPWAAAQDAAAPPAAPAPAQDATTGVRVVTPCGNVYEPAATPPDGAGPVSLVAEPCFNRQGGSPTVEIETYAYYMRFTQMVSDPTQ